MALYEWDGVRDEETVILRRMLYDLPEEVLKDYGREKLKQVFFRRWYQMDSRNLNFWRFILEIDDEEFNRKARKDFRTSCRIWNY